MYFEFIALDVLIFFKRRGSEQNFFDKLSITLFNFPETSDSNSKRMCSSKYRILVLLSYLTDSRK